MGKNIEVKLGVESDRMKKTAAANKTVAGSQQQLKSRLQRILRSALTKPHR